MSDDKRLAELARDACSVPFVKIEQSVASALREAEQCGREAAIDYISHCADVAEQQNMSVNASGLRKMAVDLRARKE